MIAAITVSAGFLSWPGGRVRAAIGKGGLKADKREGDGGTPVGIFPLRELWYRPDRIALPKICLPSRAIGLDSGWSDDPTDPLYNRFVPLPHGYGHERLWREDALYDLIVPLGYNDDPPMPGKGSAIFLHCARPDYAPTEGCVAIARSDLLILISDCGPDTHIDIQ
jgi:L,D-peptidoglycan transpeptidase YkuD (ErfK/YbiS/YcfS/YnhG family)